MVNTTRLERILQVVSMSDRVIGQMGLSVQIIAPSDAGKTRLLFRSLPPRARILNDFTYQALLQVLNEKPRPYWIVVPDLNTALSHKAAVVNLAMSFLLPLLGEGVTEIPGVEGPAKIRAQVRRHKERGITVNMITSLTPEMFKQVRPKWQVSGLLRRLVPIYYGYTTKTQQAIQSTIRNGDDKVAYQQLGAPRIAKPQAVTIPHDIAIEIERLSETVLENQLGWPHPRRRGQHVQAVVLPFSIHKTFRAYLRAHALLYERTVATDSDLLATQDFACFVRYDRPEKI